MNAARLFLLSLALCTLSTACGDDTSRSPDPTPAADAAAPGVPDAGAAPTMCDGDVECDNGVYCDGQESCEGGFCVEGERVVCDDGIKCTLDVCSEDTQSCESTPVDADGDGYLDANCKDENGDPFGTDCDDDDPLRFPGNIEICDPENRDEDCDPSTLGFRDADDDGYVDAMCCNPEDDSDGAALNCGNDCDDLKNNVHPGATEACDQFDNDCDGDTDEGVSVMLYPDVDRDGHGSNTAAAEAHCAGAVGFAVDANDCNDTDPEVFEGQFEICDGKDNNCDGEIDEIQEHAPWFEDADGDGFGSALSQPIFSCIPIPGRVLSNSDCQDDNAAVHPAAAEACDAIDNDCNGLRDYRIGVNDFEDDDGDGLADAACDAGDDCDDRDSTTGAGMIEICDRLDNDCDGIIDEETVQTVWYLDEDGDGWGVKFGSAVASCNPLPGRASNFGDCDDGVNSRHPGALETCNGKDDDCDGTVDEQASYLCQLDNAIGQCNGGSCSIYTCISGYADDDAQAANGCEAVAVPIVLSGPGVCSFDAECDDLQYCNGKETCDDAGNCLQGTSINCAPDAIVVEGPVTIGTSLDIVQVQGVELITGDLTINATNVSTLVGLESLTTIGGNLIISGASGLKKLSGSALSNLQTVGGDIIIENNDVLIDVDLPSLLSARSLQIRNNPSLVVVQGYASLITLGDGLMITDNDALEQIDGFDALTVIDGGNLPPWNEQGPLIEAFQLAYNDALTTVSAFAALERILGNLVVESNAILQTLSLPALQELGGGLNLVSRDGPNASLSGVQFPSLLVIGGGVYIYDMTGFTTLGLPVVQQIGGIDMSGLDSLAGVQLQSLETILGPIFLTRLPIFSMLGLPAVTRIGSIDMAAVDGMVTLNLPELVEISMPPLPPPPVGQDPIDFPPVGIRLFADYDAVMPNKNLATVLLPKLEFIDGPLHLVNQEALTTISAPVLADLTNDMQIDSNPILDTLDMPMLQSVGDWISITWNQSLPDLDGFDALTTVTGAKPSVTVCYNETLNTQSRADFIAQLNAVESLCGF